MACRPYFISGLLLFLFVSLPSQAAAEAPAARAAQLNEEGKTLVASKNYQQAYEKFRQATALSPEGRFYFNMCGALSLLNRYQEAIAACEQVASTGADERLIEKTNKALAQLHQLWHPSDSNTDHPSDNSQPNNGNPSDPNGGGDKPPVNSGAQNGVTNASYQNGQQPVDGGAAAPAVNPFLVQSATANPDSAYKWSLGVELGGVANQGIGRKNANSSADAFVSTGFDVRVFSNFLINEAQKLGLQSSIAVTEFAGTSDLQMAQLTMIDFGGAVFLQRRLSGNLFWTPLVGVLVSLQTPGDLDQSFLAIGGHAELGLSYVFGPKNEHAITFAPALNVYGPASGSTDKGETPENFNLDQASATFTFGLGYQYRFSTPFGSSPLVTLE